LSTNSFWKSVVTCTRSEENVTLSDLSLVLHFQPINLSGFQTGFSANHRRILQ
jgi:hypothetical protein